MQKIDLHAHKNLATEVFFAETDIPFVQQIASGRLEVFKGSGNARLVFADGPQHRPIQLSEKLKAAGFEVIRFAF